MQSTKYRNPFHFNCNHGKVSNEFEVEKWRPQFQKSELKKVKYKHTLTARMAFNLGIQMDSN